MERLNDILGRAAQRRTGSVDQQAVSTPAPLARASYSPLSSSSAQSSASARRQVPEQGARSGQRYPYASRPSSPASRPAARPEAPRSPRETRDLHRYTERESADDYTLGGYAAAAYPDPARYSGGAPRSLSPRRTREYGGEMEPPSLQEPPVLPPSQRSPLPRRVEYDPYSVPERSGNRYHADVLNSRADMLNGYDAQDDYEDEDEEGEPGIYYGDWESDDDAEPPAYRPAGRVGAEAGTRPSTRLREPVPPYLADSSQVTSELRTMSPVQASVPRPAQRAQEARPTQRFTQPLNQQIVSALGRERERETGQGGGTGMANAGVRAGQTRVPVEQASPVPVVLPRKPVCPRCKGAGYVREAVPYGHPHFGKAIACECKEAERREKRRQQLRELSNLDDYERKSFQTFDPRVPGVQEAYQAAREFAQMPEGWLLLSGPSGCGKTHLAIAIARQALDSGAVVLFETVPDLLDHLRAAFAPTSDQIYDQLFSKMREAELLILDDLGAHQSSPWATEKLFQLLNYRYNMGMPTVVTANIRALQNVDERIRSRLGDVALVTRVVMDRAQDYRPRHAKRS